MRLGMVLPFVEPDGTPLTPRGIADGAQRIERARFDGCWVLDAIGRGFALPDPLIASSVAATVTDAVELGTCILQVPLRNPVELAYHTLTSQLVSGGRLLLGVGAGSTATDYGAGTGQFAITVAPACARVVARRPPLPCNMAAWTLCRSR